MEYIIYYYQKDGWPVHRKITKEMYAVIENASKEQANEIVRGILGNRYPGDGEWKIACG